MLLLFLLYVQLETACKSLRLLRYTASPRQAIGALPVLLELSGRLVSLGVPPKAPPEEGPPGASQEVHAEGHFEDLFGFALQTLRREMVWQDGNEGAAAEALQQSQLALAGHRAAAASCVLRREISELLDEVYGHLRDLLLSCPASHPVPLSPQQQRLLLAAVKALFSAAAAQRRNAQELLTLLAPKAAAAVAAAGLPAEDSREEDVACWRQDGDIGVRGGDSQLLRRAICEAFSGLAAAAERLLREAAAEGGTPMGSAAFKAAHAKDETATEAAAAASAAGEAATVAANQRAAEVTALGAAARWLQQLSDYSKLPLEVKSVVALGRVMHAARLLEARREETAVSVLPCASQSAASLCSHQRQQQKAAVAPAAAVASQQRPLEGLAAAAAVMEKRQQLLSVLRRHAQTGSAEAALLLLRSHLSLAAAAAAALKAAEAAADSSGGTPGDRAREGPAKFFAARPNAECFYYAAAAAAAAAKPEIAFEWDTGFMGLSVSHSSRLCVCLFLTP